MRFRFFNILIKVKNTKEEIPGMSNIKMILFNRKKLYDEIWQLSVSGTAKKYNLNYSKLLHSLKEYNIPYPPSSYWSKVSLGIDVSNEVVPLPESAHEEIYLYPKDYTAVKRKKEQKKNETLQRENKKTSKITLKEESDKPRESNEQQLIIPDTVLPFLEKDERDRVLHIIENIEIKRNSKLHPVVVVYKESIKEWKKREKESTRPANYRSLGYKEQPKFINNISNESLDRIIKILDRLFKIVEKLGGEINMDLSMKIRMDVVHVEFIESKEKKEHDLTKQEAKELLEYKDKIKHYQFATKPHIPKYDYSYNGKLRIKFSDGKYIKDNEQIKIEDRLDEIIIRLYQISEDQRVVREKKEEEHQRYLEEQRKEEELKERIEKEKIATQALVNEAKDYQIAIEIRNLIKAVELKSNLDEKNGWIEWAKKKADWFDPTVAKEDEILGKRNHKLTEEEKQLIEKKTRNFYWW